jgi:predicted membrane protein
MLLMLPFQGEIFSNFHQCSQGVAIGLEYIALSGRKLFFLSYTPRRCHWAGLYCRFRAKIVFFILYPKALTLGWIILPFQGENCFFYLIPQGVAIGLDYIAVSGRKLFFLSYTPRRCHWAGLYCRFTAIIVFFILYPKALTLG